jgi:hypothetical protein
MTPAGEPFAAAIDGLDDSTWALPLAPLTATSSPEAYSPGEQPPADRLAAAARLVSVCLGGGECARGREGVRVGRAARGVYIQPLSIGVGGDTKPPADRLAAAARLVIDMWPQLTSVTQHPQF